MKEPNGSTLLSVALEAQERELDAQFEGARAMLEARLQALGVLEDQFKREHERMTEELRKRVDQVKQAKRALGLGVRSISGLLT